MAALTKTGQERRHLIILQNDVQEVPRLSAFVEEMCQAMNFDTATTMKLILAIEEAVVNVMVYAYPAGTKGDVSVSAVTDGEWVTFVISDKGKPFDPTLSKEVDITLPVEERKVGGLGIHLVRQIMDSVSYEWKDGMNVLMLKKKI